jgi:hypothetical protein
MTEDDTQSAPPPTLAATPKSLAAPPLTAPPLNAPSYVVVTDDCGKRRKGMVLPNTPEIVKELGRNFRPATPYDLGVAGLLTRGE